VPGVPEFLFLGQKLLHDPAVSSTFNDTSLVNYGERYRRGERISTAVVESMVNRVIERRMTKQQQMRWSRRGAHLLIQVRLAVLEDALQDAFRRWYPRFPMAVPREATPA
jgi:hypothetical protein